VKLSNKPGGGTPLPGCPADECLVARTRTHLALDELFRVVGDANVALALVHAIRSAMWQCAESDGRPSSIGSRSEYDCAQAADAWLAPAVREATAAIWQSTNPRARPRRLLVAAVEIAFTHFGLKVSPWADDKGGTASPFILALAIAVRATGADSPSLGALATYVRMERRRARLLLNAPNGNARATATIGGTLKVKPSTGQIYAK
jgi:hypothetical protein